MWNLFVFFFMKRERIRAAKDVMEAKQTLEENQRKLWVSYATHIGYFRFPIQLIPAISNSWKQYFCIKCSMMESRKADQEEEKRARERIRQHIDDDKVPFILM